MALNKRNQTKKFQFSIKTLLLCYGSLALMTSVPVSIVLFYSKPGLIFFVVATSMIALVPAAVVFAGQYFLLYLPIKEIQARESDPLLVFAQPNYPFFGLKIVHFLLGLYGDFKLQRDAFQRLTESYRSLCQLEPEAAIKALLKLPVEHELSTAVSLRIFDQNHGAFLESREMPQAEPAQTADAQAERYSEFRVEEPRADIVREIVDDRLKTEFEQALQRHERDFVFQEKLYVFQDRAQASREHGSPVEVSDHNSNERGDKHLLVLEIVPRRLWTRFPKIYRRFFYVLMLAIERRCPKTMPKKTKSEHQDDSLARNFLAAQNLSRVFVDTDHFAKMLPSCIGLAHRPATEVYGDFITVAHDRKLHETIAITGNVPGKQLLSGLAAYATVAVLSAELARIKATQPHPNTTSSAKLHALVSAVHHFVFSIYLGKLGVELSALFFDHQTGKGEFVSFGQPFPYLISPNERKPLVLGPKDQSSGMLGISPEFSFSANSFSLLPGQILLVCTAGILGLRDQNNRSFEKEVNRGKLSSYKSFARDAGNRNSATQFADIVLQRAVEHIGNKPLQDDISLVCLEPYETFPNSDQGSPDSSETPFKLEES